MRCKFLKDSWCYIIWSCCLFGFRLFRSLCTPFSVILMSLMVLNFPVILHCFSSFDMLVFSEKAFWNCPFSISAVSVGSECKVPSDLRGGICLPSDLLCFYKSPESFHTVWSFICLVIVLVVRLYCRCIYSTLS